MSGLPRPEGCQGGQSRALHHFFFGGVPAVCLEFCAWRHVIEAAAFFARVYAVHHGGDGNSPAADSAVFFDENALFHRVLTAGASSSFVRIVVGFTSWRCARSVPNNLWHSLEQAVATFRKRVRPQGTRFEAEASPERWKAPVGPLNPQIPQRWCMRQLPAGNHGIRPRNGAVFMPSCGVLPRGTVGNPVGPLRRTRIMSVRSGYPPTPERLSCVADSNTRS